MIYTCPDCGGVDESFEVCGMCRETTFGLELECILAEGCHCERTEQCEVCSDKEYERDEFYS